MGRLQVLSQLSKSLLRCRVFDSQKHLFALMLQISDFLMIIV
jgi:hypothetical protein